MTIDRPDLTSLPADVQSYIENLEATIARLQSAGQAEEPSSEPQQPSEPPTTQNVITISGRGMAKRTPRHLYARQRRGGMGVFDLDTPESDPPAHLVVADESESLILITSTGRAFRLPVAKIIQTAVNSRGQSLWEHVTLLPDEELSVVLADRGGAYAAILTDRGYVRWLVGHLLGPKLKAGTALYDAAKFGRPVSACWAPATGELFVTSRQGLGIRFSSRQLPLQSCALGIRLNPGDQAAGIVAVNDETKVLMLTGDGKGTVRLMESFRANKSLGIGGKVALKTENLISLLPVGPDDDALIISRLGKVIRFQTDDIPEKTGPVQGVNCMALRADECVAAAVCPLPGSS